MCCNIIILAPLEAKHEVAYLKAFSAQVMTALRVRSLESERHYLHEQFTIQDKQQQNALYGIFEETDNVLIGAIQIRHMESSRGQLYVWMNENYWGLGYFQQALILLAKDYFDKTGDLFFDATVDMDNVRSYKALKKTGFADLGIKNGPYGKQFVLIFRNKKRK